MGCVPGEKAPVGSSVNGQFCEWPVRNVTSPPSPPLVLLPPQGMDGGAVSWFLSIPKTASTSSSGVARAGQGGPSSSFFQGGLPTSPPEARWGLRGSLLTPFSPDTHTPPFKFAAGKCMQFKGDRPVRVDQGGRLPGTPHGGCPEPDLGSEAPVSFR